MFRVLPWGSHLFCLPGGTKDLKTPLIALLGSVLVLIISGQFYQLPMGPFNIQIQVLVYFHGIAFFMVLLASTVAILVASQCCMVFPFGTPISCILDLLCPSSVCVVFPLILSQLPVLSPFSCLFLLLSCVPVTHSVAYVLSWAPKSLMFTSFLQFLPQIQQILIHIF